MVAIGALYMTTFCCSPISKLFELFFSSNGRLHYCIQDPAEEDLVDESDEWAVQTR